MLETKELVKIYVPAKGVPVTALNKISLKFPEKGMVFLLGKSGSGKSTLLNVLGGLDTYEGGEIIIKGVSSKNFKQQHFDSYRNTYVGFIFQEYNVLDDFTVGANIALAIELQNRKAGDEEVNRILKEVDLEGFGARKPNELSGGQKQRVAIARALVKNPEIIMADEPTGALDSATGKQVLDTLKKLSANKLVIVVSHDREFAEQYADRIIELSDGVVIGDVELDQNTVPQAAAENDDALSFAGNTVTVPAGYHITEEDRAAINAYIDSLQNGDLTVSIAGKKAVGKRFVPTDASKIKVSDGSGFQLIKSKLPIKSAFKIGVSGLKYKKIRLVVTILLSCVAFGLFGLSDTFGSYNHVRTCTDSLMDTGVNYLSASKAKYIHGSGQNFWNEWDYSLSEKEIAELSKGTGVTMHGTYSPDDIGLDFSDSVGDLSEVNPGDFPLYNTYFGGGFVTINQTVLNEMDFRLLAGRLPDGSKDEIAVSEYVLEVFRKGGYFDGKSYKTLKDGSTEPDLQSVINANDLVGKTVKMDDKAYTITAVVDTGFDMERYNVLADVKEHQTTAQSLMYYFLYQEFNSALRESYTGMVMVGDGYVENLVKNRTPKAAITEGYMTFYSDNAGIDPYYLARLDDVKNEEIVWINGEKTTLGEKEVLISSDAIYFYDEDGSIQTDYKKLLQKNNNFTLNGREFANTKDWLEEDGYTVVGVIVTDRAEAFEDFNGVTVKPETEKKSGTGYNFTSTLVCADSLYNRFAEGNEYIYQLAIGKMPGTRDKVQKAVAFCYDETNDQKYPLQNAVTYDLDTVNEELKEFSKIFFYIGLFFAAFAGLMLANFIATSISYKKQEIGILRAIGSRSNDVFRIFFSESFVIAMINFVLSGIGVAAVTVAINSIIRYNVGFLVTILHFGIRQVLLLLAVSLLVALLASFVPVMRIASKKPIDAIRNR